MSKYQKPNSREKGRQLTLFSPTGNIHFSIHHHMKRDIVIIIIIII